MNNSDGTAIDDMERMLLQTGTNELKVGDVIVVDTTAVGTGDISAELAFKEVNDKLPRFFSGSRV